MKPVSSSGFASFDRVFLKWRNFRPGSLEDLVKIEVEACARRVGRPTQRVANYTARSNIEPAKSCLTPTAKARPNQAAIATAAETPGTTPRARPRSPKVCWALQPTNCVDRQNQTHAAPHKHLRFLRSQKTMFGRPTRFARVCLSAPAAIRKLSTRRIHLGYFRDDFPTVISALGYLWGWGR